MFLYLSKILPPFIYPLGLVCLLILLAIVIRRTKWQVPVLVAALALLFLGSNRLVALGLASSLEWRYLPQQPLPKADVIVVLGGGTQSQQYPRQTVEVDGAGDRVIYVASLYHQGVADHLLLSGGQIDWLSTGDASAEDMATLLALMGVPRQAMWLETTSRNTYENAVNSRAMLGPMGIRRILLVTSASHMPRSVALFEKQGFEVIPAPTDFTATRAEWDRLKSGGVGTWLLATLPSVENLSLSTRMLKEYIGMLVYRLNGWM
jgi:uncharacterized SAM-binding protein YcdF (DUF218 family)